MKWTPRFRHHQHQRAAQDRRRAGRRGRGRRSWRGTVERFEDRTLPASSITISAANVLSFTASALDNDTVTISFASGTYTIADALDTIKVTNSGTATVTGSGTGTVKVTGLTGPLAFATTGGNNDTLALRSLGNDVTIANTALNTTAQLVVGDAGGLQDINGTVSLITSGSNNGLTAVTLDDSGDGTKQSATLAASTLVGSVTGLSPQPIRFVIADVQSLTIKGGSGGNTFSVANTPTGGANPTTTLDTGTGTNSVIVAGTAGALNLVDQGTDAVTLGSGGSAQGIKGAVTLSSSPSGLTATTLTVDNSADTANHTSEVLSVSGGVSTLSGLAPVPLAYNAANLTALTFLAGIGTDTLTVDFGNGNPVPATPTGLQYIGGPANDQDKNSLVLQGGSFLNETYTATGPGAGTIKLDSTVIEFSSLRPITDQATATSFTFNAPPTANMINIVNGTAAGLTEINDSDSPPTFEKVDFANKTNVTVNALGGPGPGGTAQVVTIKNPAQASGLSSLTVNTGTGANAVVVSATPSSVATRVNAGGSDTVSVTAAGLGTGGSDTINAGPTAGAVTLNVDAGGKMVTVQSGATVNSGVINFVITPPPVPPALPLPALNFAGFGPATGPNLDKVVVANAAELPLLPVAVPIAPVEGVPLTGVVVARFADRSHAVPGNFTASIAWGDGKTSAGTVVPDPNLAGVFDVLGSHTYAEETTTVGSPPNTVAVTVTDSGSTDQLLVGQVGGSGGVNVFDTDNGGARAVATLVGQTNLVSDGAVSAAHSDANLKGAWGIARDPSGNLWVANNQTGVATEYDTSGVIQPTVITIPPPLGSPPGTKSTPTGVVVNTTSGFAIGATPAQLLFATQDGTISGWTSGPTAQLVLDNSAAGAVYTGLAIASSGGTGAFLYAANFHAGRVEVYDKGFNLVSTFTDPGVLAGYAPFGIRNVGGNLAVTFAQQNATGRNAAAGAGAGFVDIFSPSGALVLRLVSGGVLNAPYGLALAPADFGPLANDLLVANLGDGRVNAFNPVTGAFAGTYVDATLTPLAIAGLRDLAFSTVDGGLAGPISTLFFAADPNGGADGLFGSLSETPELATVADAPLSPAGVDVPNPATPPILQFQTFTADVATFTDLNPNATTGNFTATIDWGDGSQVSGGTIREDDSSVFHVAGSHTYIANGVYTITVTIKDVGTATASITSTATITDLPLRDLNHQAGAATGIDVPNPDTLPLSENTAFTADVAAFTDDDPRAKSSDFAVTIDWGDGTVPATGTVRQQADGSFRVSGTHIYLAYGHFPITTTIHDIAGGAVGGSMATASSTADVADAPLNGGGIDVPNPDTLPISENTAFTADVAAFTDADTRAKTADFAVSVDWGDGTLPSGATLRQLPDGSFRVAGTHVYLAYGNYKITTTIRDVNGGDAGGSLLTVTSNAAIADAPLKGAGINVPNPGLLPINENTSFTADVAAFTDADTRAKTADFAVSIDWGDGTLPSGATLRQLPDGSFRVAGTHVYLAFGNDKITTSIRDVNGGDAGGSTLVLVSSATILDLALAANPVAVPNPGMLPIQQNQAFTADVATFTDLDPRAKVADFLTTINWGDGSPLTPGTVRQDAAGTFHVSGPHTYIANGAYVITVAIQDVAGGEYVGGSQALAVGGAVIGDQAIVAAAVALPNPGALPIVEGKAFTAELATFTDADVKAKSGDFTIAINWGDGSITTTGTIALDANNVFHVSGTHTYTEEGPEVIGITIRDVSGANVGGNVVPVGNAVLVGDAPLTLKANAITPVEGAAFTGPIAMLTDANPFATVADFAAAVRWGPAGTPFEAATVTQPGGPGSPFLISPAGAGKTFNEDAKGSAPVDFTVAVTDLAPGAPAGGIFVTDTSTATVRDAPLAGIANQGLIKFFLGLLVPNLPQDSVAVFADANPNALLTDFKATVTAIPQDPGKPVATDLTATVTGPVAGLFSVNLAKLPMNIGKYKLVITVTDIGGSTTIIDPDLEVDDDPLASAGTPPPIEVVEGQSFSGVVGTVTYGDPEATPDDILATIDWGDGTTSDGVVTEGSNGSFAINGTHTFEAATTGDVTVTVEDAQSVVPVSDALTNPPVTITDSLTVNDAPLKGEEATIFGTEGVPPPQPQVVATFVDAAPITSSTAFSATIDWGDGSTSTATPEPRGTSPAGTTYVVMGTHTYNDDDQGMEVENYQIVVTIDDAGGSSTVVLSQADVADPVVFDPAVNFSAVEGAPFSGVVSTLSTTSPQVTAGDFTATIAWGDGQSSAGTVVPDGPQQFAVMATHTFEKVGSLPVTITVHDKEGDTITDNSTATVADAPLSVQAVPVSVAPRTTFQGAVARFSDADPGAVAGNFTVRITWGDGTTTGGTVLPDGTSSAGAAFLVNAMHKYARKGQFPVAITILDNGGSQASASATAAVGPPLRSLKHLGHPPKTPHAQGTQPPHSGPGATANLPGGPLGHFKVRGMH
jgi:uncharacterized protein (TIGR03118 family)